MKVVVIGSDGKRTQVGHVLWREQVMYRGTRIGIRDVLPYGRVGTLAVRGDRWLHSDGAANEIREFDATGTLRRIIRLRRPLEPVTAADKQRFTTARLATRDPVDRKEYAEGLAWLPWPAFKGAWVSLKVDPSGRTWARQWAADNEPARWDVFDGNGQHQGIVIVPGGLDVMEVGDDYLLGTILGPKGMEIRVYRMERT